MENQWSRTELLIGEASLAKLRQAKVLVFGLGGVGGHAAEALARSGIGTLGLVDGDVYTESNLNRQIHALKSTLGRPKVQVVAERIRDIDPTIELREYPAFYTRDSAAEIPLEDFDYLIDAVDMVTAKLLIIENGTRLGIPVISAMGAGNKTRPELVQISDIKKTVNCPLAKVVRRELRKRGINHLKVAFSKEDPRELASQNPGYKGTELDADGRILRWSRQVGSSPFVPAVTGLLLASEVVNDLVGV